MRLAITESPCRAQQLSTLSMAMSSQQDVLLWESQVSMSAPQSLPPMCGADIIKIGKSTLFSDLNGSQGGDKAAPQCVMQKGKGKCMHGFRTEDHTHQPSWLQMFSSVCSAITAQLVICRPTAYWSPCFSRYICKLYLWQACFQDLDIYTRTCLASAVMMCVRHLAYSVRAVMAPMIPLKIISTAGSWKHTW